jgi:serine/threonine protein kinase
MFSVMLDREGFVKLVDFGLAKENVKLAFDDPVSPCGSAMYVAPEVLGFNGGFMIDWWSLGVLVYELLSGSPPWNTKVSFAQSKYPHLCAFITNVLF